MTRPLELRGVDLEAPGADEAKHELARLALDADVGEARWEDRVRRVLLRAVERSERRRA